MLKLIINPLLAYIAAAPLTSLISMDLAKTEWTNIWTYVVWALAFVIWWVAAVIATLVVIALYER